MSHPLRRFLAPMAFFRSDLSPDALAPAVEKMLGWCEKNAVRVLFPEEYPFLLSQLSDRPPWLFLKGNASVMSEPALLALVGTRRPSSYGLRAGHFFSRSLVDRGFILVSGLARGIDSVAHSSSVLAAHPTVAVLAHGLDRIYPRENRGLAENILEQQGCWVSEYPPGMAPHPFHFPRRNRLIAGLSVGVVVVEAGAKSGSLITARHAIEQNREVFVVPGPYHEPGFAGSHWLLQQGAKLVTSVAEISEELAPGRLPVPDRVYDEKASALRNWMRTRGVATLEEVIQESGESDWRRALEEARGQGWLVESGPQRFVYCGS